MAIHRLNKTFTTIKHGFIAVLTAVLIAPSANAGQEPVLMAQVQQAATDEAQKTVENFHSNLIGIMKNGQTLGFKGRYDQIFPVVQETFNLTFMGRIISGRYWKKADEGEKERFIKAFTQMTATNYAARFKSFSNEKFETLSVEEGPRNSLIIKTKLFPNDEEPVSFDYMLRNFDGKWQIIDIFLKGTFSELATKKSEYASHIKSGGFDKLVDALNKKTVKIAKKSETP